MAIIDKFIFKDSREIPSFLRNILLKIYLIYIRLLSLIKYKKLDMFHIVNIELNRKCNRFCNYCPVSKYPDYKKDSNLNFNYFTKLIDELSTFNFSGDLCFTGYYEPLLTKNLLKHIEYSHSKLDNIRIILYTNGDLIDKNFIDSIKDYPILLIISLHDESNYESRKRRLKEIIKKKVSSVYKYNFSYNELSSRIGLVKPKNIEKKPFCVNPSLELTIDSEGNVIFCPDDFFSKNIMGNISNRNIIDIWEDKNYKKKRKKILKGKKSFETFKKCLN